MNEQNRYAPAADLPGALRELSAFVDFGDVDVEAIRRTAPLVIAHEGRLTAAVYDHFLYLSPRPGAAH